MMSTSEANPLRAHASTAESAAARPRRRHCAAVSVAAAVLLLLPFAAVNVVPSTDVPQLMAQLVLLEDRGGGEEFTVQWWHPNKLGYLPLAFGRWTGTSGLELVVLAWIASFFLVARRRERSAAHAALASALVFNISFHWGFVNFLLGAPLFVLWIDSVDRDFATPDRPPSNRQGLAFLVLGILLYAAHVLWLAVALLWLAAEATRRRSISQLLRRLAWLAPVLAAVVAWYAFFRETGVDQRLFWGQMPWQRLHPGWWVESLFGGLRGRAEPALAIAILLWIGLGLIQHRHEPGFGADRALRNAGLLLLVLAFTLPAVYHHTILFAARWMAPAVALLVLAAPSPRLSPALRGGVPWVLAASLSIAITAGWLRFQGELAGFHEGLEAIGHSQAADPQDVRVLGLDFVRESEHLDGYPFHHLPAYAQVHFGARLHRTFADDPASLVVFKQLPHVYPWTDRLDWSPEKLRQSDFDHFDLFFVNAPPQLHGRFLADPRLQPTDDTAARDDAPWRLYRILPKPAVRE
ncbi:MAG: hypothetical protein AAGM22_22045 [Acidobacteriota bacterium]